MSRPLPVPTLNPEASLESNARQVLAVRITDLFNYAPIIPDADAVEELHDARIAAKRLRYTLELFPSLYAASGEKVLTDLKLLQEELGQIHDSDVRITLIESELAQLKPGKKTAARQGLEALLVSEQAGRSSRHAEIVTLWRKLKRGRFEARLTALTNPAS